MKGAILIVTSVIIFMLALVAVFIQPLDYTAIISMGFSLTILVLIWVLVFNYRGIKIQISSDSLTVRYGLFDRKSIPLDEIVSCRLVKASFGRFGGVGVRYGIDGSWAYTTSLGNAVEIVPKEGRTFVFSSANPQQICQIINNKMKTRKT